MNRTQAEHILEAYTAMTESGWDTDATNALREVILDAMTSYSVTTPNIAWQDTRPFTVPNTIPKPIVTCNTGGAL